MVRQIILNPDKSNFNASAKFTSTFFTPFRLALSFGAKLRSTSKATTFPFEPTSEASCFVSTPSPAPISKTVFPRTGMAEAIFDIASRSNRKTWLKPFFTGMHHLNRFTSAFPGLRKAGVLRTSSTSRFLSARESRGWRIFQPGFPSGERAFASLRTT